MELLKRESLGKVKERDSFTFATCKNDQQKCNCLQLGLCVGHTYANGYAIAFSTLIELNKFFFAIMGPIGLGIRPNCMQPNITLMEIDFI